MTVRERNLWLIVGGVFLAGVLYSVLTHLESGFFGRPRITYADASPNDYLTAQHMLRTKNVILGHRDETAESLSKLETGFYNRTNPDEAQLKLLKEIERLSDQTHLGVNQKSMIQVKKDTIGVAIEGKTGADAFFRFLEQIRASVIHLKVQRLQVHSLPEEKMLNYQIVISTLLVEKGNGWER